MLVHSCRGWSGSGHPGAEDTRIFELALSSRYASAHLLTRAARIAVYHRLCESRGRHLLARGAVFLSTRTPRFVHGDWAIRHGIFSSPADWPLTPELQFDLLIELMR